MNAPRSRHRPSLILLNVGLGTFLTALAGSSVSLALPVIQSDFQLDTSQTSWVMLSFLVTTTSLMLVAGRLADLFGHRRMYLFGYTLFGAASLVSGFAQDFTQLVALRAVQGMGGALVMASGPALLTLSFSPKERGKAMGLLSTATYLGLTLGPSVGGALVTHFSWRWIFGINAPFVLLVVGLGVFLLPKGETKERLPFDFTGTILLLLGLPLFMISLSYGTHQGFLNVAALSGIVIAFVSSLAFILVERRCPHPLLDLRLFSHKAFSGAALSALCNYIALFIPGFLMPFYLAQAISMSPAHMGLVLSAQPALMALVVGPSGWLSDRLGSRGLAISGMGILAAGLAWLALSAGAGDESQVLIGMFMMGAGTGIFISPNSSTLMGSAPRERQGVAGSILALSRNLGMMLGIALGAGIFEALGGKTGQAWTLIEYSAYSWAMLAAALVSLSGAVVSGLRPKPND